MSNSWVSRTWFDNIFVSCDKFACFFLCFIWDRKMYRHLITVKVGIKCRTNKRMKSDCFSRHQLNFEGFNWKSVKCWCTVKQNIFILDYFFKEFECHWISIFDQFFSLFWCINDLFFDKLSNNEWSKHLYCNIDWQTTFIKIEVWTYSNNWSSWIIHSLSEQILSKYSFLSWEHIWDRFEDFYSRATLSCWIFFSNQKIVDRLLKKSDFILFYNIRHPNLNHLFESWVSHKHSSIEKIHIWRSKSSSIKLNHRSNIRWNHRKFSDNHILRFYPRDIQINEQFDQTHYLFLLFYWFNSWELFNSFFDFLFYINRFEHKENPLRTWCKWNFISILIEKVSIIWLQNCCSKLELCDDTSHSVIFYFKSLFVFIIKFFYCFHFLSLFICLLSFKKCIKFFESILIICINFFDNFIFELIRNIFYYHIFYIS